MPQPRRRDLAESVVRPITPTELQLQVNKEAAIVAADKVQNVKQKENYQAIAATRDEAHELAQAARDLITVAMSDVQQALDAITEGFPETGKTILRQLNERLDTARQGIRDLHGKLDTIAGQVQTGLDIEELDVESAIERTHLLDNRNRRVTDFRRVERDYRPGPGGGVA
jgi:hypothetical protein